MLTTQCTYTNNCMDKSPYTRVILLMMLQVFTHSPPQTRRVCWSLHSMYQDKKISTFEDLLLVGLFVCVMHVYRRWLMKWWYRSSIDHATRLVRGINFWCSITFCRLKFFKMTTNYICYIHQGRQWTDRN